MTDDARKGKSGADGGERPGRIPPPAFPPGSESGGNSRPPSHGLDGAFISPDDPMPSRPAKPKAGPGARAELHEAFVASGDAEDDASPAEDAFISPDEPIPHREPVRGREALRDVDPGEILVTGMGHDAHLDPAELAAGGDPHVSEVAAKVSKLAEALKRRGEAGLRTTPEMDRFDATLRAYCVGYIAGRRAEDEGPTEY